MAQAMANYDIMSPLDQRRYERYGFHSKVSFKGTELHYDEITDLIWNKKATDGTRDFPYVVTIGDYRARRAAMIIRNHFKVIRINYFEMRTYNVDDITRCILDSLHMRQHSTILFLLFSHVDESLVEYDDTGMNLPLLQIQDFRNSENFARRIYQPIADILKHHQNVQFVWVIPHNMDFERYFKNAKKNTSHSHQHVANLLYFAKKPRSYFRDQQLSWGYHWRIVRDTIMSCAQTGPFKYFFTLPEIPLQVLKMYNATELTYLHLNYRDHTRKDTYWLILNSKNVKDHAIKDVVAIALLSFVRAEESKGNPLHPSLIYLLAESKLIPRLRNVLTPYCPNIRPSLFERWDDPESIQHAFDSELEDAYRHRYERIMTDVIPGYSSNNNSSNFKLDQYEFACKLQSMSIPEYKKNRPVPHNMRSQPAYGRHQLNQDIPPLEDLREVLDRSKDQREERPPQYIGKCSPFYFSKENATLLKKYDVKLDTRWRTERCMPPLSSNTPQTSAGGGVVVSTEDITTIAPPSWPMDTCLPAGNNKDFPSDIPCMVLKNNPKRCRFPPQSPGYSTYERKMKQFCQREKFSPFSLSSIPNSDKGEREQMEEEEEIVEREVERANLEFK